MHAEQKENKQVHQFVIAFLKFRTNLCTNTEITRSDSIRSSETYHKCCNFDAFRLPKSMENFFF